MQALDDPAAAAYLRRMSDRARELLEGRLVGVYVLNAGSRDDYLPGRSDLDVAIVVTEALDPRAKAGLAEAFRHAVLRCPAPRLELVVYRREVVAAPGSHPQFELNLNTGSAIRDHLSIDPAEELPHWFVLDLAAASIQVVAVTGPRGPDVFGEADDEDVVQALAAAHEWHARHDTVAANRVLNACRTWRWISTGRWSSKTVAASWAIEQGADVALITHALELRRGLRSDPLPQAGVEGLARHVSGLIEARRGRDA
jgi:aminoglycoside adenylyltransferase-like protein